MMTVSTGRAGSEATVGARFQHLFHSHPPTSWAEASHVTELQAKPGQGPDLRRGSWDPASAAAGWSFLGRLWPPHFHTCFGGGRTEG